MINRFITCLVVALAGLALVACSAAEGTGAQDSQAGNTQNGSAGEGPHVLIFSHTTGWRHDSIEAGIAGLTTLAEEQGFQVTATEDPDIFNEEDLASVDVIILLNSTSGKDDKEWFTGEGAARGEAFQAFLRSGKGVVGIHGASDSHYGWPWYGRMIGGYFISHPEGTPTGTLEVVDHNHASTMELDKSFSRTDEWYYLQDYNPGLNLLITLDPQSIGEADYNPNPISWYHEFDGGRVFYTSMGHTIESYSDPVFLNHVAGGLDWALGQE